MRFLARNLLLYQYVEYEESCMDLIIVTDRIDSAQPLMAATAGGARWPLTRGASSLQNKVVSIALGWTAAAAG